MTLYIFDTDHLSLYARNHPQLIARLQKNPVVLTTTAINVEEQLRGRLAQVAEATDGLNRYQAYQRLTDTVMFLSEFKILPYNLQSQDIYQTLKSQRIRVGTQDLRIASITIAHDAILLTRNLRDFEKIPRLRMENWTDESID
ncbi:MAG: type II toxin-antitoxin system VapC family toxin [Chroococcales cyanobacterium]